MVPDTNSANGLALFLEPIRGTHTSAAPLMVLGLTGRRRRGYDVPLRRRRRASRLARAWRRHLRRALV
jgi:hypothetical protein